MSERRRLEDRRAIRVELIGSNRAEAMGLVAVGSAPLCQLCRRLIRAGVNPDAPVEAFRNGILALRARSLLAAAQLTVKDGSSGPPRFVPYRSAYGGVPARIAPNASGAPGQPPTKNNVPREATHVGVTA